MAQYRGTVKSFNELKGYGFIESPETNAIYGKDVFVLKTSLQGAVPGDQVTFSVVDSHKGPQAENLLVLNRRPMAAAAPTAWRQRPGTPMNRRGAPAPAAGQHLGIVKSFNPLKGWGFITSDDITQTFGKDLFFMKSSLLAPVQQDQEVYFTIFESEKGAQAQNIEPAIPAMPIPARPAPATQVSRMPAAFRPVPVPAPGAYRPAVPMRGMRSVPVPQQMAPMAMAPMAMAPYAAPMQQKEEYFFGMVKGYNEEKGWGFITCQAAKDRFGKEVFLLRTALAGQAVEAGALLGFKVNMSPKGPQADSVAVLPPDAFGHDGQPGRRYVATVKLYHHDKGWGFVTSEEIQQLFFGKDIFLHNKQLNDNNVIPGPGDEAHFSIEIAESGKLQAYEVDIFAGGQEATFEPVRSVPPMTMRSAPY